MSRIASTCLDKSPPEAPHNPTHLKGTIPFLVFSLEITSNNLIYEGNGYTSYQLFLLTLVSTLYDRGYGYRKIAKKLNKWGVKTARGNSFFNTSVSSILKKKRVFVEPNDLGFIDRHRMSVSFSYFAGIKD